MGTYRIIDSCGQCHYYTASSDAEALHHVVRLRSVYSNWSVLRKDVAEVYRPSGFLCGTVDLNSGRILCTYPVGYWRDEVSAEK